MIKRILCLLSIAVLFTTGVYAQRQVVRLTRYEGKPIIGVSASSGFEVKLIHSDRTKAVVEISEELEDDLIFSLAPNGMVRIGLDLPNQRGRQNNQVIRATIYCSTLLFIEGTGAVTFTSSGTFNTSKTTIDLSNASRLQSLNLNTDYLFIKCSGASDITLTGKAKKSEFIFNSASSGNINIISNDTKVNCTAAKLTISGESKKCSFTASSASRIDGINFNTKELYVYAISSSNVSAWATGSIDANSLNTSRIRYRGNPPVLNIRSSGASSVKAIDLEE